MSGSGRPRGGSARAAEPPPAAGEARLATVLLDGSLLIAASVARSIGGAPGSGTRASPRHAALARTSSGAHQTQSYRRRPSAAAPESTGAVLLDKGESEGAFISTLRTHYIRKGTAESFAPTFKSAPHKVYNRADRAASPGGHGSSRSGAPLGTAARLERQEQQLWAEREEELVDAQERRFAQMEDALAAREAKREAYLVHRLEASAAEKIAEHRRRQEAASKVRLLAVQRAQHLPSLKQAAAATRRGGGVAALQKLADSPVFPASPALAAAVGQAAASIASLPGISTLQAGLEAGSTLRGAGSGEGRQNGLLGAGRAGWQEKRRAAAAAQVDVVYEQIQAAKAAGTKLLSPLDTAKVAAKPTPAAGSFEKSDIEHKAAAKAAAAAAAEEEEQEDGGYADRLAAAYMARQEAAAEEGSARASQRGSRQLEGGEGAELEDSGAEVELSQESFSAAVEEVAEKEEEEGEGQHLGAQGIWKDGETDAHPDDVATADEAAAAAGPSAALQEELTFAPVQPEAPQPAAAVDGVPRGLGGTAGEVLAAAVEAAAAEQSGAVVEAEVQEAAAGAVAQEGAAGASDAAPAEPEAAAEEEEEEAVAEPEPDAVAEQEAEAVAEVAEVAAEPQLESSAAGEALAQEQAEDAAAAAADVASAAGAALADVASAAGTALADVAGAADVALAGMAGAAGEAEAGGPAAAAELAVHQAADSTVAGSKAATALENEAEAVAPAAPGSSPAALAAAVEPAAAAGNLLAESGPCRNKEAALLEEAAADAAGQGEDGAAPAAARAAAAPVGEENVDSEQSAVQAGSPAVKLEQERSAVAAAYSTEAVQFTRRASASLLFGGEVAEVEDEPETQQQEEVAPGEAEELEQWEEAAVAEQPEQQDEAADAPAAAEQLEQQEKALAGAEELEEVAQGEEPEGQDNGSDVVPVAVEEPTTDGMDEKAAVPEA